MKTAIYIRVSTEEQAKEGYSISAQKQRLKAYCIAQDWEITGMYVDEGLSAKDTNRPELERMIKDIEAKKVECVLVYKLDRLTRSVLDLYQLLQLFDSHDCKFKSATEVYDTTTAIGRLFITLVAALAQWERENLAERIRFGLQEKARQGKWAVNLAPFGYEIKGDYLEINKAEASIVKEIYHLYLTGLGMAKIARELNNKGLTTKAERDWHSNKIQYILSNPTYTGKMRWNYRVNKENYFEVEDAVPAIIEKEVFDQVQKIMGTRRTAHPRAATSEFIFSGVLKCARCGSPMAGRYGYSKRGETIHRPRGYYCTRQRQGLCDMRQVSEKHLEQRFLDEISKWDIRAMEIPEVEKPATFKEEKERIKSQLEEVEKRKKKWQYAWANDMISDEDLAARMEEEHKKEQPLKEQLHSLPDAIEESSIDENDLLNILSDMRKNWNYMTALEKKNFLGLLVKLIKVDKIGPNGKVDSVIITDIQTIR